MGLSAISCQLSTASVLVTDGYWKKSLAAVRAMAADGLRPVVGEVTRLAPALFSRAATATFVYPSPRRDTAAFVEALRRTALRHSARVVLPMEEETLVRVARARDEGTLDLQVPCPAAWEVERLRDKGRLPAIADACGVPVPSTVVVVPGEDLSRAAIGMRGPFVVKPRIGSGARGQFRAKGRDDLSRIRPRVPLVVQELLPASPVVCVSLLLSREGEVLARFAHRRLRTHPATGGPSTLCESVHAPDAEALALRLLRSVGWWGVAMVEFLWCDGWKAIEVNPRFWGSLSLAVRCGVNFPAILVRHELGLPFSPALDYADGVRYASAWPRAIARSLAGGPRGDFDDPSDPAPGWALPLSVLPWLLHPDFAEVR